MSRTTPRPRRTPLRIALLFLAAPLGAQRDRADREPPAVVASGDGPTTWVLLSGVVGGVAGFDRLDSRLVALGHRVLRVDAYQLSLDSADVTFDALARRVERVMDAHGVRGARLVGHAHGGGVALRLAARAPERIESVHLLDVGAQASNRGPVLGASLRLVPLVVRVPGGRGLVRRRFVKELRATSGHGDWLDERTRCSYVEPILQEIDRVVAMAFKLAAADEPEPVSRVLARVHAPVTLLLGDVRTAAGPSEAELAALAALPKTPRVERITGAAHFPHEEAPDAVVRLLVGGDVRVIAHRVGGER